MFDTEIGLSDRERTLKHLGLMNEVSAQALRYALPVYFASDRKVINNGTGILIETDNELIGVTALHCVTSFEEKAHNDSTLKFYFGSYAVNPSAHVIDRNQNLDLMTFKFPKKWHSLITSTPNNSGAKLTVSINDIHQDELQPDSVITFGGFPGSYRRQPQSHYVLFGKVSFGPCGITTSGPLKISSRMEKVSNWIQTHYMDGDFTNVGGLSGAPVFLATFSKGGIWHQKLAGFIYEGEYFKDDDMLYIIITPARVLQKTGHTVNW